MSWRTYNPRGTYVTAEDGENGWRDLDAESARATERAAIETRARAERDAREADAREIEDAVDRMATQPLPALRSLVAILCRQHRITVVWTDGSAIPGEARAYANWRKRRITTPHIRAIEDGATALHEIGHILQGACPNREPHRKDPTIARWWNCLECERDAWARALALVPFSPTMQHALSDSLRRYVRKTPASPAVLAATTRAINGTTWREDLQRRINREVLEMKIAEIRQIAKEAGHGI